MRLQGIGSAVEGDVHAVGHEIERLVGRRFQGDLELEVRACRHHILLGQAVAVDFGLVALFKVGVGKVRAFLIAISRIVCLFRVTVGREIHVEGAQGAAHGGYAAHGEEVAWRTVTHDAAPATRLYEVAVGNIMRVLRTEEMAHFMCDGGDDGTGKAARLLIARSHSTERSLTGKAARAVGYHQPDVVVELTDQVVDNGRAALADQRAGIVSYWIFRRILVHDEPFVLHNFQLNAHVLAVIFVQFRLYLFPPGAHGGGVAVSEVTEHLGRHEQRNAEAIHLAAVVNGLFHLCRLPLCGNCLPPQVGGSCKNALQRHGVLARGIDYTASFMVVGVRLLCLHGRGIKERKGGKHRACRDLKTMFHLNTAFSRFMGFGVFPEVPEYPDYPEQFGQSPPRPPHTSYNKKQSAW